MDSGAFYKIFIPQIHKHRLEIPLAFNEKLGRRLPGKVRLEDGHNNVWSVKVGKIEHAWYFIDGWSEFARDNMLSMCDLIAFDYFRKGLFSVGIFEPSGAQKIVLGPDKVPISAPANEQIPDDSKDEDEEDLEGAGENESEQQVHRGRKRANDGGDESSRIVGRRMYWNGSERWRMYDGDCNGSDIFRSSLAKTPQNPYFVTKIIPDSKSNLLIPKEVVREFNLDLPDAITLVDPQWRQFPASCLRRKDGGRVVSGGWWRLCNANLVRDSDIIVCEFIRDGDGRQFLRISFVRP